MLDFSWKLKVNKLMNLRNLFLQLIAVFVITACQKTSYTEAWSTGQSMPTARSEMTSTLIDGKIYVIGGIRFWGSTDKVEAYDIEHDNWEKLPDLPKKLNHIGIASAGKKVFVSGGFLNMVQTEFVETLYAYDIEKRQWTSLQNMPKTRGAHYMIYRNGHLHILGGRQYKEVWSYAIESDSWSTDVIAPIPAHRDHINVLQDDQHLYIVGGRQMGKVKSDCWRYDFDTRKWTSFTKIPTPRGGQTAALYTNQIHITGGEDLDASTTFREHNVYNLSTESWQINDPLPTPRHGLTSEIYNGKWYIIGGGRKAGVKTLISASDQVEIFTF